LHPPGTETGAGDDATPWRQFGPAKEKQGSASPITHRLMDVDTVDSGSAKKLPASQSLLLS